MDPGRFPGVTSSRKHASDNTGMRLVLLNLPTARCRRPVLAGSPKPALKLVNGKWRKRDKFIA